MSVTACGRRSASIGSDPSNRSRRPRGGPARSGHVRGTVRAGPADEHRRGDGPRRPRRRRRSAGRWAVLSGSRRSRLARATRLHAARPADVRPVRPRLRRALGLAMPDQPARRALPAAHPRRPPRRRPGHRLFPGQFRTAGQEPGDPPGSQSERPRPRRAAPAAAGRHDDPGGRPQAAARPGAVRLGGAPPRLPLPARPDDAQGGSHREHRRRARADGRLLRRFRPRRQRTPHVARASIHGWLQPPGRLRQPRRHGGRAALGPCRVVRAGRIRDHRLDRGLRGDGSATLHGASIGPPHAGATVVVSGRGPQPTTDDRRTT